MREEEWVSTIVDNRETKRTLLKGRKNMKAKMGTLKNVKKRRSKMRLNLKVDIKDVREETCALPSI